MVPNEDISQWIDLLGNEPTSEHGLYGLACSVEDYCAVIKPWGKPVLVFGDDPADMYWMPEQHGGVLFRYLAADSFSQLSHFVSGECLRGNWQEILDWEATVDQFTIMDASTYRGDDAPRISLNLKPGLYRVESKYAENDSVMTIIHRISFQK